MLIIIMAEIIGVKPDIQVAHLKTIKAKRKKTMNLDKQLRIPKPRKHKQFIWEHQKIVASYSLKEAFGICGLTHVIAWRLQSANGNIFFML